MQEVHNKWRQTQEAGRAVVLRSYFSSPLLPSQAQAASTPRPEKLRQLLDGERQEADSLFSPPRAQKTTSSNLFP